MPLLTGLVQVGGWFHKAAAPPALEYGGTAIQAAVKQNKFVGDGKN